MKETEENMEVHAVIIKPLMPLGDFFTELKSNNFLVTPAQIADSNKIINQYATAIVNEEELCSYLSPVFCNSPEEQVQFQQVFNRHFKSVVEIINGPVIDESPIEETGWFKKLWQHIKKHAVKYFIAAALLSAVIIYFNARRIFPVQKPQLNAEVFLADSGFTDAKKQTKNGVFKRFASAVTLNTQPAGSLENITLRPTYNWGDGTATDTSSYHVYRKEGNYTVKVFAAVSYKNKFWYNDTAKAAAAVCLSANGFIIKMLPSVDAVQVGQWITFSAKPQTKNLPDSVNWQITDGNEIVTFDKGLSAKTIFKKKGFKTVACTPVYKNIASPCTTNISFYVNDTTPQPQVIFASPPSAKQLNLKYKVKPVFFYVLLLLLIPSLFTNVFLRQRRRRKQKKINAAPAEPEAAVEKTLLSFSGKAGNTNLPLPGQNYLPLPEAEIDDVARLMRKRIHDEAVFLDAAKTITNAVNSRGFFNPVYTNRTRQSEYLVLIDETYINSQQVKLFEYLLELLAKRNVFIEKYYYRKEPKNCYSTTLPAGITLEKLNDKYPRHILLIMGNAYQLVYPVYPVIDSSYVTLLNRWQHKAVLTPVSFLDWGNKEYKAIPEQLPVLPVDIAGQILLMQKIFDDNLNVTAELNIYAKSFYEAALVDFEDEDELYEYCEAAGWAKTPGNYANILYQWIAAVAVYPVLRWELILAIGKKIMDWHGKTPEMNFTTLLRIARIKWMNEGRLPDFIRLSLMQQLQQENEIIARETILEVLHAIEAADVNSSHFSFEEMEVQRLTNQFILYAYNPVKYAAYKDAKAIFEKLYAAKKIIDVTGNTYLENEGLQWSTLINAPVNTATGVSTKENISLPDYLNPVKVTEPPGNRVYRAAEKIMQWLSILSLLCLGVLVFLNMQNKTTSKLLKVQKPYNADVTFTYKDSASALLNKKIILSAGDKQVPLTTAQTSILQLSITDTPQNIILSVDDNKILDTLIQPVNDQYNITVPAIVPEPLTPEKPNIITTKVRVMPRQGCTSSASNYNSLIIQADKTYLISYETPQQNNTNTNIRLAGPCVNSIAYGSNITIEKINMLQKLFSRSGITLKINNGVLPAIISNNEIFIYYTKDNVADAPKPIVPSVYIQISDNSLNATAAQFRQELLNKGFATKPVTIQNYNYNSEISYYDTRMQAAANTIRQYYNKFYPQLNVQVRLRQAPQGTLDYNNIIAVWIKKMELTLTAAIYKANNIQYTQEVISGGVVEFAFGLENTNNGKPPVTQAVGSVCIAGTSSCFNFNIDPGQKINNISGKINTKKVKPGTYPVTITIKELNIQQTGGSITISQKVKPPECDTVNSYIGKASGSIFYKNKTYVSVPLRQLGITFSLLEKDAKYGVFEIGIKGCDLQKVTAYMNTRVKTNLCDGRVIYITLLDWQNKTGNVLTKEAIFDAVICTAVNTSTIQKTY